MDNRRFYRKERLRRKKWIARLFARKKIWHGRWVRLYHMPQDAPIQEANHQVLFSVPKVRLGKAVDRHTVQRRLREAYRQEKYRLMPLLQERGLALCLAYVYTGKKGVMASQAVLQQEVQASMAYLRGTYTAR